MDLLYRLNLQRRGSMKGIMRSGTDLSKAEIGLDTNWEFLESQMFFEEQSQINKVSFVEMKYLHHSYQIEIYLLICSEKVEVTTRPSY